MANMRVWALVGLLVVGAAVPKAAAYGDDYGGDDYGGDDYGGGGGGGYGGGGGGGGYGSPDDKIAGVLDLDVNTFNKVIDGRHHAFIFLYDAYGEESKDFATEYSDIAEELAPHQGLVLAKLNAEDAPEYKEKFGIEDLPALVYLAKGDMAATVFDGEEKTAEAVTEFITSRTGEVGTVESLKEAVNKFMDNKAGRAAATKALTAAVGKLEGFEATYGTYYNKVAAKVVSKGDAYVGDEFLRLQRMIVSGSLRPEKEAEFKLRCAVLKVFSREKLENLKPPKEEEEDEEDEAEDDKEL